MYANLNTRYTLGFLGIISYTSRVKRSWESTDCLRLSLRKRSGRRHRGPRSDRGCRGTESPGYQVGTESSPRASRGRLCPRFGQGTLGHLSRWGPRGTWSDWEPLDSKSRWGSSRVEIRGESLRSVSGWVDDWDLDRWTGSWGCPSDGHLVRFAGGS